MSGKLDDHPQLAALLGEIQPGDTVIVYSLSRLGRSDPVQMLSIVGRIKVAGVTNKAYQAEQVSPQARAALVRTLRSYAALDPTVMRPG